MVPFTMSEPSRVNCTYRVRPGEEETVAVDDQTLLACVECLTVCVRLWCVCVNSGSAVKQCSNPSSGVKGMPFVLWGVLRSKASPPSSTSLPARRTSTVLKLTREGGPAMRLSSGPWTSGP